MKTKIVGKLEWQEEVPKESMPWKEAKQYAASLGDGWRLPTIQEMLSLIDYEKVEPACSLFPDTPGEWFWTASPRVESKVPHSWGVLFFGGSTSWIDVDAKLRVRCVRSVPEDKP